MIRCKNCERYRSDTISDCPYCYDGCKPMTRLEALEAVNDFNMRKTEDRDRYWLSTVMYNYVVWKAPQGCYDDAYMFMVWKKAD